MRLVWGNPKTRNSVGLVIVVLAILAALWLDAIDSAQGLM